MSDNDDVLDTKPKATAAQKKKMFLILAIIVAGGFFYIMFQATGQGGPKEAVKEIPIKLGVNNLSDDEFEKFTKTVESLQDTIKTQGDELNDLKRQSSLSDKDQENALKNLSKLMEADKELINNNKASPLSNNPVIPPPIERYPQAQSTYVPQSGFQPPPLSQKLAEPSTIGGVGFMEFSPVSKKKRLISDGRILPTSEFFQRETPNRN